MAPTIRFGWPSLSDQVGIETTWKLRAVSGLVSTSTATVRSVARSVAISSRQALPSCKVHTMSPKKSTKHRLVAG